MNDTLHSAPRIPIVGVMGSGTDSHPKLANQVGRLLAGLGVHLLTGGGQGVMAAVSQAFATIRERKGMVIGVLPCQDDDVRCEPKSGYPNAWVEISIATHLPRSGRRGVEEMSRNHINVLSSQAIIVLPGGNGTASEASLAVRYERPIISYFGEHGKIVGLDPCIPEARDIREVEDFLRQHLSIA